MSKYQEALYRQKSNVKKLRDKEFVEYRDDFATLQELVDKATPKKPIRFKNSVYISNPKCPICKTTPHIGNQKYCDECGQALDWSDEKPRDLEQEVYEEMCVGCSDEKICHEECEHCVQFYERLKEKENE